MDKDLLRKIFESNQMTDKEISELFSKSRSTVSVYRREMQCKAGKITCNVCGEPKRASCFKSEFPGVCISCRRALELETPYVRTGRPKEVIKTARTVCLKCNKHFLTRTGYKNQLINRICPICTRTNNYLGDNEQPLAVRME